MHKADDIYSFAIKNKIMSHFETNIIAGEQL